MPQSVTESHLTWNSNNVLRNKLNPLPIEQSSCINNPVLTNDVFFSSTFRISVFSLVLELRNVLTVTEGQRKDPGVCALEENMREIRIISQLTNVVPLLSNCDL